MRSAVITVLVFISLISITNAQNKMSAGAGVIVSLPMGDFGDGANTGFGANASFELGFTSQVVGAANIGYISWGTDIEEVDFSAIPVMAGVKYYFTPGAGLYGIGQLGLTFLSSSVTIPSYNFGGATYGGGTESNTETEFSFSIGAGYEIPVSPSITLDFKGLFNLISNANNIQIQAGAKMAL